MKDVSKDVTEALTYEDGIRHTLIWIFTPNVVPGLDHHVCSQVWQQMGGGLDQARIAEAATRLAEITRRP